MFDRKNSSEYDFFPGVSVQSTYIIASTPRTGSTLLSDLLWDSAKAGAPLEYLHDKHSLDYKARWGFKTVDEYAQMLLRSRTSDNGVFGMKVHFHQLNNFSLDFNSLNEMFHSPKYIFVQRNDKLRQAISFVKAMQTKQWAVREGEAVHEGQYDYPAIRSAIQRMNEEENSWKTYFSENKVEPWVIEYETFVRDPGKSLSDVYRYLGVVCDVHQLKKVSGVKMANAGTEDWVARFLAESKQDSESYAGSTETVFN